MLTEKDYCDYETCVALKELEYKESCFGHYFNAEFYIDMPPKHYQSDRYVSAPTLYEAQKFLREEKELYVFVGREWENAYYYWLSKKVEDKTEGITHSFYHPNGEGQFSSYEEALSEGVRASIKILQDEQKENN